MKRVLAAAVLLTLAGQAVASDPVIVIRPPSVSLKAGVLPMNAFASNPTTPTSPTTPAGDGFVFKSDGYEDTAAPLNVAVRNATTSLSGPASGRWDNPWLPQGFCDIKSESYGDSRKKTDVMYVPDMSVGSKEERYVVPYVTGKFAIVFICDAVPNAPNGLYVGKVMLNVTN